MVQDLPSLAGRIVDWHGEVRLTRYFAEGNENRS